ncbi:MAG: S26 family signal peptidase, partial [Planctomycetota bacterium]|nr:S26 family signal peptidase [Planctomycetota bacterium]
MESTDDTEPNASETPAGEYVSSAPRTSALRADAPKARKGGGDKAHPWRDNIEAITISIVTIVLFKYFVLEAYKIPTGSMQPTLMGNEETGIFDRVIVDKLSYHFRDPERFEIAV